jgi:hypothetical protein
MIPCYSETTLPSQEEPSMMWDSSACYDGRSTSCSSQATEGVGSGKPRGVIPSWRPAPRTRLKVAAQGEGASRRGVRSSVATE